MNFCGPDQQRAGGPPSSQYQPELIATSPAKKAMPPVVAPKPLSLEDCSENQPSEIGISESTADIVSVLTDPEECQRSVGVPSSTVPATRTPVVNASRALDVIQEALDSSASGILDRQNDPNTQDVVFQTPPRRSVNENDNKPLMATPSPLDKNAIQTQQQLATPPLLHSSIIGHVSSSGGRRSNKTPSSASSAASSASPYMLNPLSSEWQKRKVQAAVKEKKLQFPELDQGTNSTEDVIKRLQQGFRVKVLDSVAAHHRVHLYLHADRKRLLLRGCEEEKKEDEQVDSWEEIGVSNIVKLEFGRKARHASFNPLTCFSIAMEDPRRQPGAGLRFYDFEASSAEEREGIVSALIVVLESPSSNAFTSRRENPPRMMHLSSIPRTPPRFASSSMRRGSLNSRYSQNRPSSSRGGTRDQPILCSPSLVEETPSSLESRRYYHEQKKAAALRKRPQLSPHRHTQIINGSDYTETTLVIHAIEDIEEETNEHNKSISKKQEGSPQKVKTVQAVPAATDSSKKTFSGSQIKSKKAPQVVQPVDMAAAGSSSLPVVEASLAIDVDPSRSMFADIVEGEPAKEEFVLILSNPADAKNSDIISYPIQTSPYDMYQYNQVKKLPSVDMAESKSDSSSAKNSAAPSPIPTGSPNNGPKKSHQKGLDYMPTVLSEARSYSATQKKFNMAVKPSRQSPSVSHSPKENNTSSNGDFRPTVVARPRSRPPDASRMESYQDKTHPSRQANVSERTESYATNASRTRPESYSYPQGNSNSRPGSHGFPQSSAGPEPYITKPPEPYVIPIPSNQQQTYSSSKAYVQGAYPLSDRARQEAYVIPVNSRPETNTTEMLAPRGRSRPRARESSPSCAINPIVHAQPRGVILDSYSTNLQRRSAQKTGTGDRWSPVRVDTMEDDRSPKSNVPVQGKIISDTKRQTTPPKEVKRTASPLIAGGRKQEKQISSQRYAQDGGTSAKDGVIVQATPANIQRNPSDDDSSKSSSSQNSHTRKMPTVDADKKPQPSYAKRQSSAERKMELIQPGYVRDEDHHKPSSQTHAGEDTLSYERKAEQPKVVKAEQRQPSHERNTERKQLNVDIKDQQQHSQNQKQTSQSSYDLKKVQIQPKQSSRAINGDQKHSPSTSNKTQPYRSSGDPVSIFNRESFQVAQEPIPEEGTINTPYPAKQVDRSTSKGAVIEIRKPVIDVEMLQSRDYMGSPERFAIVERKPIIDVTSLSPSTTQNFDIGTSSYQLTGAWCADDFCTTTLNDMANTCTGIFAIEQVKQAHAQVSCYDPTITDQQMIMIEDYITSALGAPSAMYSFLTEGDSVWDTGLPGNPPGSPQQEQEVTTSRIRNRATQMNAQANRIRTLRNEMTFAAALKQSKARMHTIRTTQSFDDAKLPQIADKVVKEFHGSALLDMLVNNMNLMEQEKEEKAPEEDVVYYDSDPEDTRARTLRNGPRHVSATRRNKTDSEEKKGNRRQPALSGVGLDDVGAKLGRKIDEEAVVEIVQAMVNERLTLMWHPTQCSDQPNRAPLLARVWIEAGVHLLDGTFLLPKLTWTKAYDDDKTQQFSGELHKVDLLDICRIRATDKVDRNMHPFANRRLSFVIETQSTLYLFEAETMKERDRIVSGLKIVVARLASLLMLRDIRAADEFFGAPVVPGEAPQWPAGKATQSS